MRKFISFIFTFLFISCGLVYSLTLKVGVIYDVETARQEAFSGVKMKIDINKYKDYFIDEHVDEHLSKFKNNRKNLKDKKLTFFSNNGYSIVYYSNPNVTYYYNSEGILETVGFTIRCKTYSKEVRYDEKGTLDSIGITISSYNQYVFDRERKLIARWIGFNCYNDKGELIRTRHKSFE